LKENSRFHSGKISALPPWKWIFGEWKAVVMGIHKLQKWNAQIFLRKAKFHTEKEAKWTSKPQEIESFPATIPHSPAERTFWTKFFHNIDVVRVFQSKISHGNESRKILLWRLFRLFFGMKFYMPNMWTC
jgi:hypothetical protein